MYIKFQVFKNDDIVDIDIETHNNKLEDIINYFELIYNYNIDSVYENNLLLSNDFNKWDNRNEYMIILNDKEYIFIKIKLANNMINLPCLEINTTISDIKNILSIEDDIFYMNLKLNENRTLKDYNITNDSILFTSQVVAVVCS
jgi:hypothetical protein